MGGASGSPHSYTAMSRPPASTGATDRAVARGIRDLFLRGGHVKEDRWRMFTSITQRIVDNVDMLAYGVAVTDVDGDGRDEIVVCGYDGPNRVLAWRDGAVVDITPDALADPDRRAIGVAAADVDGDGREEIYILNTDTFAGRKRLADRLFVWRDGAWLDTFELAANIESLNLTAGRSVCALDRQGFGRYSIAVANYGGPLRLYEVADDLYVVDVAAAVGMALTHRRSRAAGGPARHRRHRSVLHE